MDRFTYAWDDDGPQNCKQFLEVMNHCCNGSQKDRNWFSFDEHIENAIRVVVAGEFLAKIGKWIQINFQMTKHLQFGHWSANFIIVHIFFKRWSLSRKIHLLIRFCCCFLFVHVSTFLSIQTTIKQNLVLHIQRKKKQTNYESLKHCNISLRNRTRPVFKWVWNFWFKSANTFAAWFEFGFAI